MNSSGINGISNRVLKLLGPSFIESLTYAINKSFKNKFPEILKHQNWHHSGKEMEIHNYSHTIGLSLNYLQYQSFLKN